MQTGGDSETVGVGKGDVGDGTIEGVAVIETSGRGEGVSDIPPAAGPGVVDDPRARANERPPPTSASAASVEPARIIQSRRRRCSPRSTTYLNASSCVSRCSGRLRRLNGIILPINWRQVPAQAHDSAMEMRPDGSGRQFERSRDFILAETGEIAEHNGLALPTR